MDKNWLLRTKSNHILGPISKEKVLELYQNGSIKPDDEICSGNGFWFFVRETDMVNRYLLGPDVQGFNPISEAKDVIIQTQPPGHVPEASQAEITLVGSMDLSQLQAHIPATPKIVEKVPEAPKEAVPVQTPEKKKAASEIKVKISSNEIKRKPLKKQNYLKYVGLVGFILLVILVYMRKTIIKSIFHGEMTYSPLSLLINSAHAQAVGTDKKKSF